MMRNAADEMHVGDVPHQRISPTNHRHHQLLRACRERPRRSAAHQRDEIATLQLSKLHPLPPNQDVISVAPL
jgi:hypothetical protein